MRPLALVLSISLLAAVTMSCDPTPTCTPGRGPLEGPGQWCARYGVSADVVSGVADRIGRVGAAVGTPPTVLQWYLDFGAPPPIGDLDAVRAAGADPIITWEPWAHLGDGRYDTEAVTMADIAAGRHDDHLHRWADELAAWGGVVYLRLAHEPNGDWYPWTPARGTPPETYVAAWRHVHDLFATKKVTNVRWVWTANVPYPGSSPIRPLYPGDDYVDVVGLDGYNWGTSRPGSRWREPADVFGPGLDELARIAPGKRVVVTEVACAERGGSKADWITHLVEYLHGRPEVTAYVWFDHHKEADWRLSEDPAAAAALAGALTREQDGR